MNKIYLIAEVGINHDGDLKKALKLMEIAAAHDFNAVKFQKRTVDRLYTQAKLDSPREGHDSYHDYKNCLELDRGDFNTISAKAKYLGIDWFASTWDEPSIDFFEFYDWSLPPRFIKIPSAMNFDMHLLHRARSSKYPVMASTGFCSNRDVERILDMLQEEIAVLMHCTASYPCPNGDSNINSIPYLQTMIESKGLDCRVGFSSHSPGLLVPTMAMAAGAEVIEVHVTLDRSARGSDHAASLEPEGMAKLAKYAREIPGIMGDYTKQVMPSEEIDRLRKGIRKWEERKIERHIAAI
jgi:N-acetylneuraminate synthase